MWVLLPGLVSTLMYDNVADAHSSWLMTKTTKVVMHLGDVPTAGQQQNLSDPPSRSSTRLGGFL